MDNHSTGTSFQDGTSDASGKVFTYNGEQFCPIKGGMKQAKAITRIINHTKFVHEMYDRTEDGKEFLAMEITDTRM